MADLLVSVRSVGEAAAALAGGAGLIDVKDPGAGALGRADDTTIRAVLAYVAGRCPVSAALGEFQPGSAATYPADLTYVKWGLAGYADEAYWQSSLREAAEELAAARPTTRPVAVAYADHERAKAPSVDEVASFACREGWSVLLLDTWAKDGTNLLGWLSMESVHMVRQQCRRAGVRVALAGSLGVKEIEALGGVEPDWFAVRGAACRKGERGAQIDADRVRALAESCRTITAAIRAG